MDYEPKVGDLAWFITFEDFCCDPGGRGQRSLVRIAEFIGRFNYRVIFLRGDRPCVACMRNGWGVMRRNTYVATDGDLEPLTPMEELAYDKYKSRRTRNGKRPSSR